MFFAGQRKNLQKELREFKLTATGTEVTMIKYGNTYNIYSDTSHAFYVNILLSFNALHYFLAIAES